LETLQLNNSLSTDIPNISTALILPTLPTHLTLPTTLTTLGITVQAGLTDQTGLTPPTTLTLPTTTLDGELIA